jgi:hypothetical protein
MRVVTSPGRSSQHAQHVTRDLDALAVDLQLPMAARCFVRTGIVCCRCCKSDSVRSDSVVGSKQCKFSDTTISECRACCDEW